MKTNKAKLDLRKASTWKFKYRNKTFILPPVLRFRYYVNLSEIKYYLIEETKKGVS